MSVCVSRVWRLAAHLPAPISGPPQKVAVDSHCHPGDFPCWLHSFLSKTAGFTSSFLLRHLMGNGKKKKKTTWFKLEKESKPQRFFINLQHIEGSYPFIFSEKNLAVFMYHRNSKIKATVFQCVFSPYLKFVSHLMDMCGRTAPCGACSRKSEED